MIPRTQPTERRPERRAGPPAPAQPPRVSFEFFPPKTPALESSLWAAIERLAPLDPAFVSVTYGAGGGTRSRTHRIVGRLIGETALVPAAHLTCVGASRAEVDDVARAYWALGVRRLVALRGDPPEGATRYEPQPDGYDRAADLVAGLRRLADFEISVAAHPETHPDAASAPADLDNLKRKLDAGASRAITQFFFDPDVFFRFRDRVVAAGIDAPLVPGILPVTNVARPLSFAAACGTGAPDWVARLFDGLDSEPDTRQLVAAELAAEQCRRLQAEAVEDFHFYTLNRAELTLAICRMLGVLPQAAALEN